LLCKDIIKDEDNKSPKEKNKWFGILDMFLWLFL
jgi:hypothetical protein